VSNCSIYNDQIRCVDDHCGWDGGVCVRECFKYQSEQSCDVNVNGCFWVNGDADKNVSGSCLIEVS
jgi:hypothetical protein